MAIPTPLFYWKFDGNSNESISSNNGSDTAITYSTGNGVINQGAGFNGSSSYITTASSIGALGDCTFNLWAKYTSTGGQLVADFASGTGWTFRIADNGAGKVVFMLVNYGVGTNYQAVSTTTVNTGSAFMITGTRNGSTMKMYVNGALEATTAAVSTATTNIPLAFGCERYASTNYSYYNGALDEFGIWNTDIGQTEITALYNSGAGIQYPFSSTNTSAMFQLF